MPCVGKGRSRVLWASFFNQSKEHTRLSVCVQGKAAECRFHLMLITLIVNPLFIDLAYNNLCLALN